MATITATACRGTVTAAKELQAIQDEIESLRRRQATLEDEILELMEQIEPLDAELAELGARRTELAATAESVRERITVLDPRALASLQAKAA